VQCPERRSRSWFARTFKVAVAKPNRGFDRQVDGGVVPVGDLRSESPTVNRESREIEELVCENVQGGGGEAE
jgi:hypothetical protein